MNESVVRRQKEGTGNTARHVDRDHNVFICRIDEKAICNHLNGIAPGDRVHGQCPICADCCGLQVAPAFHHLRTL